MNIHFFLQKKDTHKNMPGIVSDGGPSVQGEFRKIPSKNRTNYFKIVSSLLDRKVRNLDDHGCYKNYYIVNLKADESLRIFGSYSLQHKTTLHCAERKAKKHGKSTMQHSNF